MKPMPTDPLRIPTVPSHGNRSSRAESAENPVGPADRASDVAAAKLTCPRCGGKLINPESLGWCRACGYCSSLEEERAKAVLPPTKPRQASLFGAVEFFQ